MCYDEALYKFTFYLLTLTSAAMAIRSCESAVLCVCMCACRRVLVFGGNGFLGASSVERLVGRGHSVTVVNRGNWYWDSERRILPRVDAAISCDRNNGVHSCTQLVSLIDHVGQSSIIPLCL